MLRTCATLLRQRASQIFISTRLTATDPSSGSINAAHDKFAEREQALENAYFRKQTEELLAQLRNLHSNLEKQSDTIEDEQKRIEEQIQKLEKKKEELLKKAQKPVKQ
jgi:predicted ribosome quality control (RQC) complex YloA/Tae2 family protein